MRPRRPAFAAALLATLVLALASCSGGERPPAATPAAEAPSTPAPTADATPTPSPEPPPEQACANGVAVADPEERPGLVADCVALLASRDALRGEASLDWGADLAIGRWEGVAVGGEPPRVTGLDLRGKGLTGSIPRTLRRLRLDEVRLAGNALTGCVPSAFGDARGDALYLGLPWCLRYDRLDATGEVAGAGEWAILGADGEVLATWEGLRSEAATLRVHQTDAGGTSWAAEFGAVSEGDLFEWRKASDCWVRYRVTGDPVRPAAGSGRWEFPVEWMTYAATGDGCTGVVTAATVLRVDEEPPVIQSPDIATPVRHGPWLMVPTDWSGRREAEKGGDPLRATGNAIEAQAAVSARIQPGGASGASGASAPARVKTSDVAEARRLIPLWRDPDLPPGWRLYRAEMGTAYAPYRGYTADYQNAQGSGALVLDVVQEQQLPVYQWAVRGSSVRLVTELRIIDGHAGLVRYSPPGHRHDPYADYKVQIYDAASGIKYWIIADTETSSEAVDIARSLYQTPTP